MNPKSAKDIEFLCLFCKEGWTKSLLGEFHSQKQALSRFVLSALLPSDPLIHVLRRELKRLSPDVRVELDELRTLLTTEVLKREVTEGDQAAEAKRKISRAASKLLRATKPVQDESDEPPVASTQPTEMLAIEPTS